jgi:hypothetical protein
LEYMCAHLLHDIEIRFTKILSILLGGALMHPTVITDTEIDVILSVLRRRGFSILKEMMCGALELAFKARQSRDDAHEAPAADDKAHVDGRASARADGSSGDRSSPTSRKLCAGSMPMSDDQNIERLSAEVRYINAQHELAMAERRLREARRPAWFPPAEFFGIVIMAVGAAAAMVALFTLLNDLDSPRRSAPCQWPATQENAQSSSR